MSDKKQAHEEIKQADKAGQIGNDCYLCERFLEKYPEHVPTLVRYASNLISLAQYSQAAEVLDRAQAVVSDEKRHFVLIQHGHLMEAQGQFAAAEQVFRFFRLKHARVKCEGGCKEADTPVLSGVVTTSERRTERVHGTTLSWLWDSRVSVC
jgi:hypothetical protein